MPVEDVAARFGVTPALVERRMKLAKVAPRLRSLFRKDTLTLEQMMAFTVTDDHDAQERVWKELPEWSRNPDRIREALTQAAVRFDTPLARFVGVATYVAAGGTVMRDLFDDTCDGYAQDRLLLLALADDKLKELVEAVQVEGWKWVKAEVERDYSVSYRRIWPDTEGEAKVFTADSMANAGAIIRIGRDGTADIDRGLVHPDDVANESATATQAAAKKADKGDLSPTLIEDLTAHRTAALRLELTRNPAVALAATVHALAGPVLYGRSETQSALDVRASSLTLDSRVAVPGDCAAHQAMDGELQAWQARVPREASAWFGWCLAQPQDTLLDLLAFTAATSVNAVQGKQDRGTSARLVHAEALAEALALDMTTHWQPSIDGFYGRLTKATLLAVVTEAKAPMQVSISTVKKPEAARYVAEAMTGNPWLPVPLRRAAGDVPASA